MQSIEQRLGLTSAKLKTHLAEIFPGISGSPALSILQGDASDRSYFRIHMNPTAKSPHSLVIMKLPARWSLGELPFLNIQRYLERQGLPVPKVYGYREDKEIVFLEDLGDRTLAEEVRGMSLSALRNSYRQTVDLLVRLQTSAIRNPDPDCIAFRRQFDATQFLQELLHFQRYMIVELGRKEISPEDQSNFLREFSSLCELVGREDQVLCHRDYHSRNLMVNGNSLGLLDFQDARLGPRSYDLASLLRDSYTVLPESLCQEMIDTFCGLLEEAGHAPIPRETFRQQFDFMALQRNLKAIGTFAFQAVAKNNDRYLQHVPATRAYVEKTVNRYKSLEPLRRLLEKYLFPWQPV
ncbi:MAG TPA: phosphotransferase [bacterium]|nr:phosphotransferase [bacterium]